VNWEIGRIEPPATSSRVIARIGLISDSHIPEARKELWPQVFEAFRGVDLVLHGGDIHELHVIDQLSELAPTYAARGNGDEGSGGRPVTPEDPRLRHAWILELHGVRIGMVHDLPVPEYPPHSTVAIWKERYLAGTDLDVIVYGDSHVERIDVFGSTLCINPGSPTFPHNLQTRLGTIGLLEIRVGQVDASIWQLTDDGAIPVERLEFATPLSEI
jgi:putative phosphoesterase